MKVFIVLCALIGLSLAASVKSGNPEASAEVLKSELDNIGAEDFKYAYETSNGIIGEESGHLNNAGSKEESLSVQGSFQYTGPDGKLYSVSYTADENGFQPIGEHIPSV